MQRGYEYEIMESTNTHKDTYDDPFRKICFHNLGDETGIK